MPPLAHAIRPDTFEDFTGQGHVIERLKSMLKAKRLPSLLFFGPPGCGKSTLALILARAKGEPFVRVSAPEAGLATLRTLIEGKSILILDELHRFSKAQQDFFLPHSGIRGHHPAGHHHREPVLLGHPAAAVAAARHAPAAAQPRRAAERGRAGAWAPWTWSCPGTAWSCWRT